MSKAETLRIRTNLYCNKKYNPAKELVKGNATPLTTHAGRISVGENGVFWAGNLNGWSVFIDEDKDWSPVMAQENSGACGLVGVVLNALGAMEVINLENQEEVAETIATLFNTSFVIELSTTAENLTDVYDLVQDSSHYLEGFVELSIGVAKDGSLSIKGVINAPEIHKGRLSLVESDRLKIGGGFSSFARSQEVDAEVQKNVFKSALKSQRQKNLERRAKYSAKTALQPTESSSAGVVVESAIPPTF